MALRLGSGLLLSQENWFGHKWGLYNAIVFAEARRHCVAGEAREAIRECATLDCFGTSSLAMTMQVVML